MATFFNEEQNGAQRGVVRRAALKYGSSLHEDKNVYIILWLMAAAITPLPPFPSAPPRGESHQQIGHISLACSPFCPFLLELSTRLRALSYYSSKGHELNQNENPKELLGAPTFPKTYIENMLWACPFARSKLNFCLLW